MEHEGLIRFKRKVASNATLPTFSWLKKIKYIEDEREVETFISECCFTLGNKYDWQRRLATLP